MDITKFAKKVAKAEGGNEQVNIGQILQILKVINDLTFGAFYGIIHLMKG